MTDIGALTILRGPERDTNPKHGVWGLKIWTPLFSDSLVPIKAKTAKKSILAQKSYGSCFLNIPYRTITHART